MTEQEGTENIEQRRRKKKVTFGELLAYVHFYYFVKLRGRMLRNIQTFYIKWIFDSLFIRFRMAQFSWALLYF